MGARGSDFDEGVGASGADFCGDADVRSPKPVSLSSVRSWAARVLQAMFGQIWTTCGDTSGETCHELGPTLVKILSGFAEVGQSWHGTWARHASGTHATHERHVRGDGSERFCKWNDKMKAPHKSVFPRAFAARRGVASRLSCEA